MLKEFNQFAIFILLLIVYFFIITPFGWILRIKNKINKTDEILIDSYRIKSKDRTKDHLNKMY